MKRKPKWWWILVSPWLAVLGLLSYGKKMIDVVDKADTRHPLMLMIGQVISIYLTLYFVGMTVLVTNLPDGAVSNEFVFSLLFCTGYLTKFTLNSLRKSYRRGY